MGKERYMTKADLDTSDNIVSLHKELRERVILLEKQIQMQNERLASLVVNEEKYKVLLDNSSDPIFSFSRDGEYQYVNKAFAEGVDQPVENIIHHKIWDVFPKEEADKRFTVVDHVFNTGETKVIEVRVPRTDEDRYYLTTVKPVIDVNKEVSLVICISKEITDRKRLERELLRLSNYDALTGLFNRHYFEVEMERIQNSQMFPVSIIVTDMDKLKSVNDQYGHSVGDRVIQKVAAIILESVRSEDIAARTGGDEFTILLPKTGEAVVGDIVKRLQINIQAADDDRVRLSVGYATGEEGSNLVDVFRTADERMYLYKRRQAIS
jgi:diguanylate cyclase (GGDEF)-like protein/PAS domain S-box-containing protein